MRTWKPVCVAVTFACLAVAACGSSGSSTKASSTSTTVALTKTAWLAAAQKLCDKYNAKIDAVGGGAQDPASRNAASSAVLGLIRQHVAELRALGYPPGDRAKLEPIENGIDAAIARLERTGPHPNIEQAVGQAAGPWIQRLQAYGSC